jgi:FKBP-type peptidyl-prolyl cis-trans isomerase SlyD
MLRHKSAQRLMFGLVVGMLWTLGAVWGHAQSAPTTVTPGTQVSLEYTLTLDDEQVLDSNVGSEPFTYVHGSHQIVPGLEKALEGMKVGERKQITVPPEEGYGIVRPEAIVEVDKSRVPPDARQVGARVQGQNADGQTFRATVAELKDDTVVLNFNHPLAGKTLHFDVKVLDIKQTPTK